MDSNTIVVPTALLASNLATFGLMLQTGERLEDNKSARLDRIAHADTRVDGLFRGSLVLEARIESLVVPGGARW